MQPLFKDRGALPGTHQTYVERPADRQALNAVRNGEYLYIMAPRQMGKTSLLNRLSYRLQSENLQSVYVDLAELTGLHKAEWYGELGKLLSDKLTPDQVPILSNQFDLRRYLLDAISLKVSKTSYLALFLDEVEGACSAHDADGRPFSNDFFSVLRSMYNQRETYPGVLVVVMAGAKDPNALVTNPAISPFNVCSEIVLDDFTQSETYVLTSYLKALGLSVHQDVPELIWIWTGGHPCLTQCICRELEHAARNGLLNAVTPEIVTQVVKRRFLRPPNSLSDYALRSLEEKLRHLSAPAAHLWSRLQAGDAISWVETNPEINLELFLAGAVKSQGNQLIIRNQIYQHAFAKTDNKASTQRDELEKRSKRVMKQTVRIFISSTWVDLQPEREAVGKALHRMQQAEFAGMEYFGSQPETPKNASLAEVDRSDVYVGIFAHRYGSGITEAEYRRAREKGLPCLIYLKDDEAPIKLAHVERDPEKLTRLEALKQALKAEHVVSFFISPDNLATQLVIDLHNFLGKTKLIRKPVAAGPKYEINIDTAQGIAIGDNATVIHSSAQEKPSQTPSAQAGSEQRCADLAANIGETWSLIKLYEEQRRLANDPKEKRRTEREIADLREQLSGYRAEARELGCDET